MLYDLIKPLLFALEPEVAHDVTLKTLKILHQLRVLNCFKAKIPASPVNCMGLVFPNPIGLAAGLDKNGECLHAWPQLGFGFVEMGTVTPRSQAGNPKPRLFRLTKNQAIINRMGFNNKGVDYLLNQIKGFSACPLGINIGKNKDTPLEGASEDYLYCYERVYPYADYVTVNLSSPNTPGLRTLQYGEPLKKILAPLKQEQLKLSDKYAKNVPIVVKIAPDLTSEELQLVIADLMALKIEGVIATNTTITRGSDLDKRYANQEGGLSGAPLFEASTQIVKQIYQQVGESLPIIAVGGIMNKTQAQQKFAAGAKLIQLYSGLIYSGPGLIQEIAAGMTDPLHQ